MALSREKVCRECNSWYHDNSLRNQKLYCGEDCKSKYDAKIKKRNRKERAIENGTARTKVSTKDFSDYVQQESSGEYTVIGEYINSKTPLKIKHMRCGEDFNVRPYSFKLGTRCPHCNFRVSKGEKAIADFFERNHIEYKREYLIPVKRKKHKLRIDFFVDGIGVEYDGVHHFKPVDYFGGKPYLLDQQHRDAIKDKYCADNGIPLIRIPYWDFDNIDAILTEKLLPLLNKRAA